jgi:predicted RNA-binding Zn-ribbon protein involved in translation (DUF1610 family)
VASFYISCTTCKARLKIRDESAVGEIHTCPKCGSMVMITPPRTGSRAAEGSGSGELFSSPVAAASPLQMTFDDAVEILNQSSAPPAVNPVAPSATSTVAPPPASRPIDLWSDTVDEAPPSQTSPRSHEPTDAATAERQTARAHDASLADTVDAGASGEFAAPAAEAPADALAPSQPLMPGNQWIAPQAQVWRQWLLYGGSAVAGIALAVAVFGYAVVHTTRARQLAMAQTPEVTDSAPTAEAEAAPQPEPQDAANFDAPAVEAETNDDETEKVAASHPDQADVAPAKIPGPAVTPGAEETEEPNPPPPVAESPFDNAAPAPTEIASNSDLLDQFGEFLGSGSVAALPIPEPPPAEPEPLSDHVSSASASDDPAEETPLPRPAPRNVDVAGRLADPIVEIEFTSVPLVEFLEFMSDLSTIPITLEPEALAFRRLSPTSPVSVRETDTTVEGVLLAALAPLKLGYVANDGHLLVTGSSAGESRLRTIKHPVEDLSRGDPEQLAELGRQIERLVAPESWKTAGGEGSIDASNGGLSITQTEAVHYRVIAFCETLRLSRGMPQRTRFDAALFQPQAPQQAAREKLAAPVTLNYRHPTKLTAILAAFGKATGVTILVDWQAAAHAGWSPDAKGSVVADNGPLREALARLLAPMDLTYRIVDGSTLEVTTPEKLRTRIETAFYPVRDLVDGKPGETAMLARLEAELGEHVAERRGAFHFDPTSKYLIAAFPQSQQAELAALLESMRTP